MQTNVAQRWFKHRSFYRRPDEVIDPRRYDVAAIAGDVVARAFVERHHYSRSFPAARRRFGLYERGELVGVAVFSVPPQADVLRVLPCAREAAVELGRFVLLDRVPGNGETWFLSRCLAALAREGFAGVVSFSDPVPRTNLAGRLVFPGHLGGIYKAASALYTGRATPRSLRLLPDGTVLSPRTISKIRARTKGWAYGVEQLVVAGAQPPSDTSTSGLRAWLAETMPAVTRPLRHGGNHRYLFPLRTSVRTKLPEHLRRLSIEIQPYPTLTIPRAE